MNAPRVKIAQLDDSALSRVQALEKELGTYIVALEPQTPYARLTDAQIQHIKALEQELGVILLAYRREQ